VVLGQGDYRAAQVLYEESLALCNEMDEKTQTAYALLGLGLVGLNENSPEARENILQSLHLRQEMGEKVAMTSSLIGVAGLALQDGNIQRAAQILGAVASAVKALNTAVEPEMIHFHNYTLAVAQEQLGKPAFQSAWEEGSRWSLEEAVNVALEK